MLLKLEIRDQIPVCETLTYLHYYDFEYAIRFMTWELNIFSVLRTNSFICFIGCIVFYITNRFFNQ